jgi:hypothetical protein
MDAVTVRSQPQKAQAPFLKHPDPIRGIAVGLLDGHTERAAPTELDKLVWEQ